MALSFDRKRYALRESYYSMVDNSFNFEVDKIILIIQYK